MNNFSESSNSELISLLLDGQLSKEEESILYKGIASDTEMQEELHDLLEIRESVKKDHEAFHPPAEVTNNVFSKLGYTSPYGKTAPVDAVQVKEKKSPIGKTLIPVLFMLFVGTSSVLYFNSGNENENVSTPYQSSSVAAFEKEDKVDETAQSNQYLENTNEITKADLNEDSGKNSSNLALSSSDLNNKAIKDQKPISIKTGDFSKLKDIEYSSNIILPKAKLDLSSDNLISPLDFVISNNFDGYWYVHALGVFSGSMAQNNYPTQSSSALSNINFGLFRQTSKNLSFGIQFGIEPFDIYETDNNDVPILQSKDVFWVAASARYDMNFASVYNINPFVSVGAGGSTVGFLSRGIAGLQYKSEKLPVAIQIGYEGSMINYSVYKDYTSVKSGLTAGISFAF